MEQLKELLLDVWREAGRHTDIAASLTNIVSLLARCLPVAQLLMRRIEPERSCIETVGMAPDHTLPYPVTKRSDCSPAPLQSLLAWCQRGEVRRWRRGAESARELQAAVPPELDGELLLGPLV